MSLSNGVKVTFQDVNDNNVKYIAVTDNSGNFKFINIEVGTYSINVEKEGYKLSPIIIEDGFTKYGNVIELVENQTKHVTLCLSSSHQASDFDLELTDIYGTPIGNSFYVPMYTTTISFKLYNGTDKSQVWRLENLQWDCFVIGDYGAYSKIFSYFEPESGTLVPGDNVVLIGKINQDIWNIYDAYPKSVYSEIQIGCNFSIKKFNLDIEF